MKQKKKDSPAHEPKTIEELAKLLRRAKRCWPSVGSYEMIKLASRCVRKVVKGKKNQIEAGRRSTRMLLYLLKLWEQGHKDMKASERGLPIKIEMTPRLLDQVFAAVKYADESGLMEEEAK